MLTMGTRHYDFYKNSSNTCNKNIWNSEKEKKTKQKITIENFIALTKRG